jgi:predicted dithiol-disulfide oxidoreductase (DUF899 family)
MTTRHPIRPTTRPARRSTTTNKTNDHPAGAPPVVDVATWQAASDSPTTREKAHMREGDAIAAARRRLPMVEVDGTTKVVGVDGPAAFIDLFQDRANQPSSALAA